MKDGYGYAAPLWGLGGLIVGAWVGSRFGGGWGNGCGAPGYGGHCGPGYGYGPGYGPGYAPGYYTGDRPCHEDKQDDKIACIQAQVAAIGMAEKKDNYWSQKLERAQDMITDGKIYRATCMKPNGHVQLHMSQVGSPYRDEPRYIDTHVHHHGRDDGRRGYRDNDDWCNESALY